MTFDGNIDMLQMAFWQIILASAPVLLIALAIGLFIGIFQAATSINEMTLKLRTKSNYSDAYTSFNCQLCIYITHRLFQFYF